ncbi:heme exporter protein CcmD [Falsigemmobacter intermedius]|nr:heme exporter protein CcmD [Falsigemmobacter intermedius]
MMPDLGKYAFAVLASYGSGLGLLIALVVATVLRGRKVRQRLEAIEKRQGRTNG